jgi:hypothetical protein
VLGEDPHPADRTFMEPILAWRAWALSTDRDWTEPRLRPVVGSPRPWPPLEPARAACRRFRRHPTPDVGCTCGLHALVEPEALRWTRDPVVVGTVALWGRVVEHERGYRAEFGYPQRLRLVCRLCFWRRDLAGSVPDVAVRVRGGGVLPLCLAHLELAHRYGLPTPNLVPAEHAEQSLLSAYAVDLLGVSDGGRARARLPADAAGVTSPPRPRDHRTLLLGWGMFRQDWRRTDAPPFSAAVDRTGRVP